MNIIRIEKLTLNVGSGKEQDKLEKSVKLLKNITGLNPVKTVSNKRIPNWGLRPGLAVGCKLTLRKAPARELLSRLLMSKDNKLTEKQFDNEGNISFGIHEYIDIPGVKYDPQIGVLGLQATVTLEKIGYGVKRRRLMPRKIPKKHRITKQESMEFMKKQFDVDIGEKE